MKEREYLKELGKKITDSSVRKEIVNEYEAHIEDCKAALMESGMTEVEAEEEAVRQMGDPQEAGEAMDKIYHKVFDSNMFLCAFLILSQEIRTHFYGCGMMRLA